MAKEQHVHSRLNNDVFNQLKIDADYESLSSLKKVVDNLDTERDQKDI